MMSARIVFKHDINVRKFKQSVLNFVWRMNRIKIIVIIIIIVMMIIIVIRR